MLPKEGSFLKANNNVANADSKRDTNFSDVQIAIRNRNNKVAK
jgi:hypothetical protein